MISIIIPVYNAQAYIKTMLDGILGQSYNDWELILIVSKSKDESLEICQEYEQKNKNIAVVAVESALPGEARNIGMQRATGEYIMFADADDIITEKQVLSYFVEKAKKTDADIVVGNYERLWKNKKLPARSHEIYSKKALNTEDFRFDGFFSVGTLAYVWGKLYKKSFLENNRIMFEKVSYAEDKLFNINCYLDRAKYAFIDQICYTYRMNASSVSHKYNSRQIECWMQIAQSIEEKKATLPDEDMKKAADDIIDYLLFFGIFFAAKKEYEYHGKSMKKIYIFLKKYNESKLPKRTFKRLAMKKSIKDIHQHMWKLMMWGFSLAMTLHLYWLLALGIKLLIDLRIDERLSDTGMRS